MQVVLSLSLGLGLAAACGFRVFIPPLMMGVASRFDLYELEGSFVWVGGDWAIAVFAAATLLEIGGYYIPWIDNLLDTVATPAAIIGGIFVTSASLEGDVDPSIQWILAAVFPRRFLLFSRLSFVVWTSGGLANPIISTLESVASLICILLSFFLAIIIPFVLLFLIWKAIEYITKNKAESTK